MEMVMTQQMPPSGKPNISKFPLQFSKKPQEAQPITVFKPNLVPLTQLLGKLAFSEQVETPMVQQNEVPMVLQNETSIVLQSETTF